MTNYTTAAGVQQFSITIASGSTTGTVNLGTAVGAGAFITYGGSNPAATTDFANAGAYLSWVTTGGTTTITATRNTSTTNTVVVTGSMTDGDTTNLVVKVQQGTVSITAGTTNTAAVTAPGSDGNTVIHHLGNTGTGTTLAADIDYGVLTQSGNTVTATYPAIGTTVTGFCLIEFQAACMTANAVQRVSATSSSSVTSWTASLGANVVLANALSFWAGKSIATITTADNSSMMYGVLSAVGTFTAHVNTGAADAKTYNACILELNSGVLNSSVQRGTTTLTGVTSNTTTLSTINETYAGVSFLGNSTTAGTAQLGESTGAVVLTTATPTAAILHQSGNAISSFPGHITITSTTAGSTLVAVLAGNASGGTGSISSATDSASQVWTRAPSAAANGASASVFTDIWYFSNTVAGVTTFNPTVVNGAFVNITVYELTGITNTSPIDASGGASNQTTASTTMLGPPITTTASNDFVVSSVMAATGSIANVLSPYTLDNEDVSGWQIAAGTISGQQASFTWNTSSLPYCGSAAAFFSNTSALPAIQTTKATATANITSSWEVFEFPAYSSATAITWYPAINFTPAPLTPGYVFMGSLADEVLKLPLPFLPRLPDVAPPNPPAPPSSVAMNVQAIITSTPLRFFPRIADAPLLTPADRPNFFSPIFPLNFRLPWLPARVADAPPVIPPDKPNYFAPRWLLNIPLPFLPRVADAPPVTPADRPNYFAPRWLLNLPIPWLPARAVDAPPIVPPDKPNYFAPGWLLNFPMLWQARIVDAAPRALAAVPNFFAGIPAIISAVVSIPWFPRVSDAPLLTPSDKPNYFAPRWLLNLPVSWMPKISTDAPPITPADKPSFFSPIFALNLKLPWLPRVIDAAPITPVDRPNFFGFPLPLNFKLPFLPRISDAPPVIPPDRPSIFSFPLPLNLKLPWLIRVADAPPMPPLIRESVFLPRWPIAVISTWFSRITVADAPPIVPVDRPNFFAKIFPFNVPLPWLPRVTHAEPPSRLPPDGIIVIPEPDVAPGGIGKLLYPLRRRRKLSPDLKNDNLGVAQRDNALGLDNKNTTTYPKKRDRIL